MQDKKEGMDVRKTEDRLFGGIMGIFALLTVLLLKSVGILTVI